MKAERRREIEGLLVERHPTSLDWLVKDWRSRGEAISDLLAERAAPPDWRPIDEAPSYGQAARFVWGWRPGLPVPVCYSTYEVARTVGCCTMYLPIDLPQLPPEAGNG